MQMLVWYGCDVKNTIKHHPTTADFQKSSFYFMLVTKMF